MAIARLAAFNEGSLLRRTLLHVGTFVVGSVAFLGLVSFVLVSIARGILPQRGEPAEAKQDDSESAAPGKTPLSGKGGARPKRKGATAPTTPSDGTPSPDKDE